MRVGKRDDRHARAGQDDRHVHPSQERPLVREEDLGVDLHGRRAGEGIKSAGPTGAAHGGEGVRFPPHILEEIDPSGPLGGGGGGAYGRPGYGAGSELVGDAALRERFDFLGVHGRLGDGDGYLARINRFLALQEVDGGFVAHGVRWGGGPARNQGRFFGSHGWLVLYGVF